MGPIGEKALGAGGIITGLLLILLGIDVIADGALTRAVMPPVKEEVTEDE